MNRDMSPRLRKSLLGFASGVMVAAGVWSLIIPAMEMGAGKGAWSVAMQYTVVLLVPFVYYCLMARPAWYHSWFNYRALVTAVAALLMGLTTMVDWDRYYMLWKEKRNAKRS